MKALVFALTIGTVAAIGTPALAARTSPSLSAKGTTRTFEVITTGALVRGKVPGVKYRADIAYLEPGREEKLDLYLPAKAEAGKKRPAIVMIHGGGWTGGMKQASRELEMGTMFARAGYVAVSVEYHKKRGDLWPQNLMDCKNAVRWVRANAGELDVDVDHIGVIGGSAGGHLSLMVAYTGNMKELAPAQPYPGVRDDVQACVDLYGIADLQSRRAGSRKPAAVNKKWGEQLLNEAQREDAEQWRLGSPVEHVTSSTPPTFIIHGDKDKTVDYKQSVELTEKLKQAGVEHKLIILPGAPHSVRLYDKRVEKDLRPEVLEFFAKHLSGGR